MRLAPSAAFLGSAVIVCSAWLGYYATGTLQRAADGMMRREVARGHFSGTVLISRDARVLFAKGYGLANVDWDIPNSLDTKFEIGSITKTFTAALIMQLEGQRKLALNDSICTYVDACPTSWSAVTLRDLLAHTSGIYNLTLASDFAREHGVPQTREAILARIRAKPLSFTPGERFEYSNSNYFLLAMVIEKITGQPYEGVLRDRILTPLAMRDTGVVHRETVLSHHATGYRPARTGTLEIDSPIDESWSFGAGSLYSTVGDLQKWSEALGSGKVLSQPTLARMWQPVKGEYGYGWEIPAASLAGGNRRIVQHTGLVAGFVTVFQRLLNEHLTVIVLSNSLASQPRRVAQSLTSLVLGEPFVPSYDRDTVELTPEALARYVGDYELGGEIFTITSRNGRLFVSGREHPELPEVEILAASATQLFLREMDGEMTVTEDGRGRVTGFVLNQGNSSRIVKKVR